MRWLRRKDLIGSALIAAQLFGPKPLMAQEKSAVEDLVPPKAVSVRDRPRPGYSPLGLRLGTLSVQPKLTLAAAHDDNIFATENSKVDDFITVLSGGLSVATQGRTFPVSVFGDISSSSYAENSSEDFIEWQGGASLGYNSPQRTQITLTGSIAESVESRGEPSTSEFVAEPIEYRTDVARLEATHTVAFGQLDLDVSYESLDFMTVLLEDGSYLSQDFRDRDTATIELQASMRVASSSAAFLRAAYVDRNYDAPLTDADIDRDSSSKALYAGAAFDITNLMRGEIGVGVLEVDDAASAHGSRRSLALRSNVEIFLTQLVTLTLNAQRASSGADIAGSSSYIATGFSAALDYEMRRNLILSARVARQDRDYSGINESFAVNSAGLSAQWLLNRNLRASLEYSFIDRAYSEIDGSYAANRIMASLRLAL